MRQRLFIGLAAAAFVMLVSASSPSGVAACSGTFLGSGDPPADVIFNGTAVRVVDPRLPFDPTMSSTDLMEWTFVVDEVEKGTAEPRTVIRTERHEGACGYAFELGGRYRVLAIHSDSGLYAGSSSGSSQLAPLANPPPIEKDSGPGSPLALLPVLGLAGVLFVSTLILFTRGRRRNRA